MLVSIVGIAAVTIIELYALKRGKNGKMLLLAGILIGLMAGVNASDLIELSFPSG